MGPPPPLLLFPGSTTQRLEQLDRYCAYVEGISYFPGESLHGHLECEHQSLSEPPGKSVPAASPPLDRLGVSQDFVSSPIQPPALGRVDIPGGFVDVGRGGTSHTRCPAALDSGHLCPADILPLRMPVCWQPAARPVPTLSLKTPARPGGGAFPRSALRPPQDFPSAADAVRPANSWSRLSPSGRGAETAVRDPL